MKRIGIIAALPEELKPLVKDWQREGQVYAGRINGIECVAVSAGMGARAAENACAMAFGDGPLDALASIGWAGSLSCGLKPPGAFVISEVMDGVTGKLYPTASTGGYRLVTLDHVARHDEKRKIAERYQAPLVDMEAATVARVACEKGAAFYCFKGVSDGANDKLPDFNRFLDNDGQLRMPSFIAYALLHPRYWASLKQLGENSKAAASNLARLVADSIRETL
jgi:adenosylhomocysteine nucleosidase